MYPNQGPQQGQYPPPTYNQPGFAPQNQVVGIKTYHNTYVGVNPAPQLNVYTIGHCKDWEHFQLERLQNGKVALKTHHNTYVGVGGDKKVYSIGHCKEWEQFQLEYLPNGRVTLRTHHNTYLGSNPGNGNNVYAIEHCKEWESFAFEPVVVQQQPQQGYPPQIFNPPTPMLQPRKISLRTHHNTFVGVNPPPQSDVYTIGHCKEWETFTLEYLPNGRVTLRTHHNTYLGVSPDNKVYSIGHCKEWESFLLEQLPNGRSAFRTFHNTYLGANPGNGPQLYAIGHCKEWETFQI